MRNMSFMLTTQQVKDETKFKTRRLGWWNLKPGQIVMACEKCMGLKKGEKINKLKPIRIISTCGEQLDDITQEDVIAEGFPNMTPGRFVEMFCREMKCGPYAIVNNIEFEYVKE